MLRAVRVIDAPAGTALGRRTFGFDLRGLTAARAGTWGETEFWCNDVKMMRFHSRLR
jgi:hypothetical protein